MTNQTRMIWVGLIVALGFGLTVEALKTTRTSANGSSWRPRLFGFQDLEDGEDVLAAREKGRSTHQAARARSRLLKGRIAGLSTNAALAPAAVVAQVTPSASPAPGTSNLGAPNSVNTDDAKKKTEKEAADKKKKRKKKKKSSGGLPVDESTNAAQPAGADLHESSNDVSGGSSMRGGGDGGSARTVVGFGAANVIENPQTLEEWMAYILREPNYDHTMKLIEAQQQHSIDSEIFHQVVAEMMADTRVKMQEYAILALGSTPSLKSFILLEAAALDQPEGSDLRLQARTYLKAYSKVENIRYLGNAIASEIETSTAYEALRLIQAAVTNYKPKATQPAPAPRPIITRQFTSLIPVLTRVASSTSTDASLRREATQTLQQVQTLVGSSTTTPAA